MGSQDRAGASSLLISDRRTRRDKSGFSIITLTSSNTITAIINMVSSMLLSRYRSLYEYGTYSQLSQVTSISSTIFLLGMTSAISYFAARAADEKELHKFICTYFTVITIITVALGLVLVAISPSLVYFYENESILPYRFVLLLLPWINVLLASIGNLHVAYGKTIRLIVFRLTNSVLTISVLLVAVWLKISFHLYMIWFIVTQSLLAGWVYIEVYKLDRNISIMIDVKLLKQILVFSVPIGLAGILGTLNNEISKLIVTRSLGTEMLAVFTNCSKEMPVTMLATSITAVLMPKLTLLLKSDGKRNALLLWNSAAELSFILMSFFASALFVFAPQAVSFLYSEKYASGVWVYRISCIHLIFRAVYFGMILNVTGNTKAIMYSSCLSLLLNVMLSYLGFHVLGLEGCALANLLSIAITGIAQLIYSAHILKVRITDVFPWMRILLILGINTIIALLLSICLKFANLDLGIHGIIVAVSLSLAWIAIFSLFYKNRVKYLWHSINLA